MRYPRNKFRIFAFMLLCCLLAFSLCGCGEDTNIDKDVHTSQVTYDYYETINDIEWCVTYNSETREIVSISATMTENDTTSKYYQFISYYHGDRTMYARHTVILSGTPVGDDWYKIEQIESYIMPFMDADDFERVKKTYHSCTFDAKNREITLSERTIRFEERLVFKNMPD